MKGQDGLYRIAVDVGLAHTQGVSGGLDPEVHEWSTYTYDIYVYEYDGETPVWSEEGAIDWNYFKTPYCLWVPEQTPETNPRVGHKVWIRIPEDEDLPPEMRVKYWLSHQSDLEPSELTLILVDSNLEERPTLGGTVAEDGRPDARGG